MREICLFSKANTSSKEVTVFFFTSSKGMLLRRREERETISTPFRPELSGLIAPEAIEGKAALLIDYEDRLNLFDALILCRFYRDFYPWEELGKVIHLVTGKRLSKDELQKTASRIANMTRAFNIREGLKPEHDRLPKRLHREPLPSGQHLTEEEVQYMIDEYYRLRGWDKNGLPGAF